MPFQIIRNDITKLEVDAIVNTANPHPTVGPGVDSAIHEKAGPQLLKARQKIGSIARGQAAITKGYDLPAKYVIHTVGPVWVDGTQNEEELLLNCYENSLQLARKHRCRSIAFPLISTGNYGFPKDKALQIAISAFSTFLLEHEMQIYLVVFDHASYKLSEKLFQSVASYIDENYVDKYCGTADNVPERQMCRSRYLEESIRECEPYPCINAAPKPRSLRDRLKHADAGFSETLLKMIDAAGKKDSEIYKKAHSVNAGLALYGHTHVARQTKDHSTGVTALNPGALCDGKYCVVDFSKGSFIIEQKSCY